MKTPKTRRYIWRIGRNELLLHGVTLRGACRKASIRQAYPVPDLFASLCCRRQRVVPGRASPTNPIISALRRDIQRAVLAICS